MNVDFRDATGSLNAVADKGLGLESCLLCGKSKVKIPVSMQEDEAAKRSLSAGP